MSEPVLAWTKIFPVNRRWARSITHRIASDLTTRTRYGRLRMIGRLTRNYHARRSSKTQRPAAGSPGHHLVDDAPAARRRVTDGFYNNWWQYIVNYDEAVKELPPPGATFEKAKVASTRRSESHGVERIVRLCSALDIAFLSRRFNEYGTGNSRPHPFELNKDGQQRTRIGHRSPPAREFYTPALPGRRVHALQRIGFVDRLNAERAGKRRTPAHRSRGTRGRAQLGGPGVNRRSSSSCHPQRMDLSFAADELLQQLVSKRQIRFLSVSDGGSGRDLTLGNRPLSAGAQVSGGEKERLILSSKVQIQGEPIYYNRLTGTRWRRWRCSKSLGSLDTPAWRRLGGNRRLLQSAQSFEPSGAGFSRPIWAG